MRKKLTLIAASAMILLCAVPVIAGPAETSYRDGRRQLNRENYVAAAELFHEAAASAADGNGSLEPPILRRRLRRDVGCSGDTPPVTRM